MAPGLLEQPKRHNCESFRATSPLCIGSLLSNPDIQAQHSAIRKTHTRARHAEWTEELLRRASLARRARENLQRDAEELAWLQDHKRDFAGQWIALVGSRLIASGSTAKQVYDRIGEEPLDQIPLVTQIASSEELPFAGW